MSNADRSPISGQKSSLLKRIGLYALVLGGVFLLGFVPMWLSARGRAGERDVARQSLRVSQIQNRIASATIDARRGEYEAARQAASDFFTTLRAEVDREGTSAFTSPERNDLQSVLAERDEVITLLARSDTAAAERLTNLYLAYRQKTEAARARSA